MRKVLSFVLVLSLILGSFSMAFAATPPSDIAASPNAEAITVGVNLGIIDGYEDGTYKPTQAVNRAEFAKLMTKALGIPESALAGYASTSFKDVSGYQWAVPYLAFCQSKGIMIGDGNGNVRPGAQISVNESMTMMMRAVGYTENSAALVGTWPAKYVSLAKNNQMYDDVANAVTLDRANAAQVIYNALQVDKVEVSADGTTKVLSDRTNASESKWNIVNMLTTGLNCEAKVDVINGTEETLINLKPYVGKKVTKFLQKDKPYAIVAIASEESSALGGNFRTDTASITTAGVDTAKGYVYKFVNGSSKFVGDDDYDYTVNTQDFVSYFLNGEDVAPNYAVGGNYGITSDKAIELNGDISGKTIKNLVTISEWDVTQGTHKLAKTSDVSGLKDAVIAGQKLPTLKDGTIDTNGFELKGITALDKLAVDNVIYAYIDSNQEVTRVEVGTQIVEGRITQTNNAQDKLTIDGKSYENADNMDSSTKKAQAGDTVKLFLDFHGDIYKTVITSGSTDKYAVVKGGPSMDKMNIYSANDDASVWVSYDDKNAFANGETANKLIGYAANKDGKVTKTTSGATGVNAGTPYTTTISVISNKVVKAENGTTYEVADDAVVFTATMSATGTTVTGITKVKDVNANTTVSGSSLIIDNKICALLVASDKAGRSLDDAYAVFDSKSVVENAAGDLVYKLIGYANGENIEKLTTEDMKSSNKPNLTDTPELFHIVYNADGAIKTINAGVAGYKDDNTQVTLTTGKAVDTRGDVIEVSGGALISVSENSPAVYKANYNSKGELTGYTKSEIGAIGAGYKVFAYDTLVKDNKNLGKDVIIFITSQDIIKHSIAY